MLFNSIAFVFFLPAVILLYFLLPHRFRWMLLLAASYFFYMSWKVEYALIILFSTLIDYYMALAMDRQSDKKSRRPYLAVSLLANLGLLFFFKYYNFAVENLNTLFVSDANNQIPLMQFLLPVGISFYTFQTLSYSIDVYFGRQKAERHFGYFALYVSFFPQLVAGPIERFSRLTPQLKQKHELSYTNISNGLRLVLYGLFIKMVIADNLAVFVDQIYADPGSFTRTDVLTGILFYSFQIYCDFYGYSIIAIGSAQLLGIRLMDNFKTPYLSRNIAEFWQRWHISLSTWFRDYLYYPLGGNRVRKMLWIRNILLVFIVSGIWHGANWTFVVWGTLFGLIYLLENFTNKYLNIAKVLRPYLFSQVLLALKTFVLVSLIWVFFRSPTLQDALAMYHLLVYGPEEVAQVLDIPWSVWILFIVFIISDLLLYNKRFDVSLGALPFVFRWMIYAVLVFCIIIFAGVENFPFIYFQF